MSPEIIGLGGPHAESLISYVTRVAAINDLTLGQLFFGSCISDIAREIPLFAQLQSEGRKCFTRGNLSVSKAGYRIASTLSALLGRPQLPLLHWATRLRGFSFARFLREDEVYCPICISEDPIPYQRMAWEPALSQICALHKCRLECWRHGRRTLAAVQTDATLYREKCVVEPRKADPRPICSPAEVLIDEQLACIVPAITRGEDDLPCSFHAAEWIKEMSYVHRCREPASGNSIARLLGISKGTVSHWKNNKSEPALSRVIELSITAKVPLLNFLRGQFFLKEKCHRNNGSTAWARKRLSNDDRVTAIQHVQETASQYPTRSVGKIAHQAGIDRHTLSKIAPELFFNIRTTCAANRKRTKNAKRGWFFRRIDRYVSDCLGRREMPTWRGLAVSLSKPGILREKVRRLYAADAVRRGQEAMRSLPEQLLLDITECTPNAHSHL